MKLIIQTKSNRFKIDCFFDKNNSSEYYRNYFLNNIQRLYEEGLEEEILNIYYK